MLIPEQPGMPAEIPRMHINTDCGYRVSMSRARIDLTLELPFGIDAEENVRFYKNCKIFTEILREKAFSFERIGLVGSWFAPTTQSGALIAELLLQVPSNDISDVTLSITKKHSIRDVVCNSLFNFSSAIHQSNLEGVNINRDLNTVPDAGKLFSCDDVGEFVSLFKLETTEDSILEFIKGR
ncbi:hypothetical protein [Pseudomonas juntendi]|uniref:hypothetical protein n=1 Tax=Pseudomonas juntendi TaxID=2666183 RepID=UPI00320806F3